MNNNVNEIFYSWISNCTQSELRVVEQQAKKSAIKWFLLGYIPIIGIFIALSGKGLLSYNFYRYVKTKGRDNQTLVSLFIRLFYVCAGLFVIGPFFAGVLAGNGKGKKVVGLDEALRK